MIDSHCHIGFDELKDNVDQLVERAQLAGVHKILTVACDKNQVNDLLTVLDNFPKVYGAFAVHPEYSEVLISKEELRQIISSHPKIIGVGETGLDYHYKGAAEIDQKKSFRVHIEVANELNKPLIIHSRDADEDTINMLDRAYHDNLLQNGGILHCFTGSKALAKKAVGYGFYISASGVITFKNADQLRSIFADIPLDRLLVETDAPYLAPVPFRGRVNEPALLGHTMDVLADIKGVSRDQIAQVTTENFNKLFHLSGEN